MAKKSTSPVAKSAVKGTEVDAFMAKLAHPLKAEIEAVRAIILGADPRINESIKWNAPSFHIQEHFATMRLQPGDTLQVVLHTGAKVKDKVSKMKIDDPNGMLKWAAVDRALITFASMKDVRSRQAAFAAILKQWIRQM